MTALSFGDIAVAFTDRKDPDRKRTPRRNSYDIDDQRAQVFQPVRHGWDWIGAVLQAFDELLHDQRVTRYKESDRLQDGDRRILLSFLKLIDFKTIAEKARYPLWYSLNFCPTKRFCKKVRTLLATYL